MKWILLSAGLLVLVVGAVVFLGALLPRQHEASRSVILRQPGDRLFAIVRDVASAPAWRSGIKGVEVLPPRAGKFCYRETSRHGSITYVVEIDQPNHQLVTRIADDSLPFAGTWTFAFLPAAGGTEVRITERGEVKNPGLRFMARFVFGYTATIDGYLRDLARNVGEAAEPR